MIVIVALGAITGTAADTLLTASILGRATDRTAPIIKNRFIFLLSSYAGPSAMVYLKVPDGVPVCVNSVFFALIFIPEVCGAVNV